MALPFDFKVETIIEEGRISSDNINEIRNWLQTTSLPKIQDEMIALFLLSCCSDVAATRDTIRAYFRRKSEAPELFKDRNIDRDELQKAMKVIICLSIPRRMPNNTIIHFFRLADTNYRNFDLAASMKLAFMLVDVSQRYNPPSEMVVVIDMKGASVMHLTAFKIGIVKKFVNYMQEGMPLRIQKIHILNANYIFDKILAMAKVFLKSELIAQIVAHPPRMTTEELHDEYVPASCLPKEYDGELPTCQELNETMVEQFKELKQFFQLEEDLVQNYYNTVK